MKRLLLGSVFALTLTATNGFAADCLRIIGTEGAGSAVTMDPAFNNLNDDSYQQNLVFNKLVNVDANFQPIPELAKAWSVSDDG